MAEHLLDRGRQEGRVGAEAGEFGGVVEEGEQAARDAVAEGLVPRDGEEEEHVLELVGGEPAFEHARHDVAGRAGALLGGEGVGVGEHVGEGRVGARVDRAAVGAHGLGRAVLHRLAGHGAHRGGVGGGEAGVVGVLVADDAGRPVVEEAAVGVGDAHDVGQRPDGEVRGELDEVGVLAEGGGHEGARPLVDRVLQGADGAGVNAAATMRRRREWSGGSWFSIIARTKARSSGVSGSRIWVAPRPEENRSGERRTCLTSACRKTAQKPGPAGQGPTAGSPIQATGDAARSWANVA